MAGPASFAARVMEDSQAVAATPLNCSHAKMTCMPIPTEPFSNRFSARPRPPSSSPTEVPEAVRVRLVPLIDDFRSNGLPGAYTLGPFLYEAIGKVSPQSTGDMRMIRALFLEAEWWQVYDLCEALVRMCSNHEEIAARIESIFVAENVPYAMTTDGIAAKRVICKETSVPMPFVELTENQLRAELRAAGKEALVGFALGVAAASATDMTQRIADCVKQFKAADLYTVRGRAAVMTALAKLEEFK
jgi:hypothetical protein